MKPWDPTTVNTILLVVVIPFIGVLCRFLWVTNQSLAKVNTTFAELAAALLGVQGQGGALQEIRDLRRRHQRMEAVMAVLLAHANVKLPDLGD